jgi:hypothetical protein
VRSHRRTIMLTITHTFDSRRLLNTFFSAEAGSHLFDNLLASYPTHKSGILFRCRDCRSYQSDVCGQGPDLRRASQLSRSSLWTLEYVPQPSWFPYLLASEGRRVCTMFHEEVSRQLHQDVASNIRCEERCAAIHGVREDEGTGILTQAAARFNA